MRVFSLKTMVGLTAASTDIGQGYAEWICRFTIIVAFIKQKTIVTITETY